MSKEVHIRVAEPSPVRGDVLSLLRDRGPLPRVGIARELGISPTTITRVVNQLVEDRVVEEGNAISPAKLGRPATEIAIKPDSFHVVGVQIGVEFVRLGIVDLLGTIDASDGFTYDRDTDAHAVLDQVADAIARLLAGAGIQPADILGIGVAVPGPVDQGGRRLLLPVNLSWRDVAVADRLEALTGMAVTVEHNVRSMALAEVRFASGRGFNSVAFVYLRTGLGAGLVVDGQPFAGGVHGAIELGHLQVVEDGLPCVCGGTGCIETVVSEAALGRSVQALGIDPSGEPLGDLWAAAGTDDRAARAVEAVVAPLSTGIAALVNLLNPELILLGGALATAPDGFFSQLQERTYRGVFPLMRPSVRVERSGLGMDAGVLGAATVALDRFFYS